MGRPFLSMPVEYRSTAWRAGIAGFAVDLIWRHEVPLQGVARESGGAGTRLNPAELSGTRRGGGAGSGVAGSRAYAGIGVAAGATDDDAILDGERRGSRGDAVVNAGVLPAERDAAGAAVERGQVVVGRDEIDAVAEDGGAAVEGLRKRYWGQHLWVRGYFCATVGAVDEATIKRYIESQKWNEDEEGFKITAPTKP